MNDEMDAFYGILERSKRVYERVPLVNALLRYIRNKYASFHVPGHKDGQWYRQAALMEGTNQELRSMLQNMARLLAIDVTEMDGTDDLHHPTGAIAESQLMASQLFGAEETYFLVGGSTIGNIALLMSCCIRPTDILIVQRNVHKSIIHGLMMAGARAVFMTPQLDPHSGLAMAPTSRALEQAIEAYPEAKAIFITSPNYYGIGINVHRLVAIAHRHGIPLLVDEAHGAHYGLHPKLPQSSLMAGADGVVQSTHKMLGGMTMSAMLHIQGRRLNRARIKRLLTMLQSSSPSYLLLASLDFSRYFLSTHGAEAFTAGLAVVSKVREAISQLRALKMMKLSENEDITIDPFKVVIQCAQGQWNGYKLMEQLRQYGCVAEMADLKYVVLSFSLASTMKDADRLIAALQALAVTLDNIPSTTPLNEDTKTATYESYVKANEKSLTDHFENQLYSAPVPFSMYEQEHIRTERVPTHKAIGYQAAEAIIPYPPGIPLLYPGEVITEATAHKLSLLAQAGTKFHDAADGSLRTIRVIVAEDNNGNEGYI